jgi:uncharacterized RDD family membrane protein YckC
MRDCILQTDDTSNPIAVRMYCPFPRRLMAILYDGLISLGLLIVASALALPFGDINKVALQDFWFTAWLFLVCLAYFVGCWRYGGMTVGMRAWKIKLINNDGSRISLSTCLLRFLVSLISLAAGGLGFFWALWDKQNRTWHDLAATTLLIKNT